MKSSRNQRVSSRSRRPQHLLEVSVRQDLAQAQRNRALFLLCCKLLLAAMVLAGGYVGGRKAYLRFFLENPDLFLNEIRVSTNGALTREQIIQTVGLVEGRNIFTFDLGEAKKSLRELPQVEDVLVQRHLPHRITIDVSERRPVAWLCATAEEDPATSTTACLIDARGIAIRTWTILPEYLHLPIICGVNLENVAPGQRVPDLDVQAALELVRLTFQSTRYDVRTIDISKHYCLVVTDRTRVKVTFGLDRIADQLARLNLLLDHLEPSRREIQTVNLLLERNLAVTFASKAPAQSPAPVASTEPGASAAGGGSAAAKLQASNAAAKSQVSNVGVKSQTSKEAPPLKTAQAKPSTPSTGQSGMVQARLMQTPVPAAPAAVTPDSVRRFFSTPSPSSDVVPVSGDGLSRASSAAPVSKPPSASTPGPAQAKVRAATPTPLTKNPFRP